MAKKLSQNQTGFGHLVPIVVGLVVIALVGLIGWRVGSDHKTQPLKYSNTSKRVKAQIVSTALAKTVSTPASTTTSTSTPASKTPAPETSNSTASSSSNSTSSSGGTTSSSSASSSPSFVAPVPAGYTAIGTVSASDLYNVKVPPASSEQPTMTIYACLEPVNTSDDLQFLGVLSYPVASADSNKWYVDLDLSSSPDSDQVISSKTATYSYTNNTWDSSTSGDYESNIAVTDLFDPGAVNNYYVWAYGSYDGTTLQSIANHLNVTQLATCQETYQSK